MNNNICQCNTYQPKGEYICCNCGTHHIRDVNAAINLKNYIPMEGREFKPVDCTRTCE